MNRCLREGIIYFFLYFIFKHANFYLADHQSCEDVQQLTAGEGGGEGGGEGVTRVNVDAKHRYRMPFLIYRLDTFKELGKSEKYSMIFWSFKKLF